MYTEAEFFRLYEAVEEQGGIHIDEPHEGHIIVDLQFGLEYCGKNAQFDLTYHDYASEEECLVRVCAEEDRIGLWPRFADAHAPGLGTS